MVAAPIEDPAAGLVLPHRNKDHSDWTVEETEGFLMLMLRLHDMRGVELTLNLLAVKDPRRCAEMRNSMRLGVALARHQHATQPTES